MWCGNLLEEGFIFYFFFCLFILSLFILFPFLFDFFFVNVFFFMFLLARSNNFVRSERNMILLYNVSFSFLYFLFRKQFFSNFNELFKKELMQYRQTCAHMIDFAMVRFPLIYSQVSHFKFPFLIFLFFFSSLLLFFSSSLLTPMNRKGRNVRRLVVFFNGNFWICPISCSLA